MVKYALLRLARRRHSVSLLANSCCLLSVAIHDPCGRPQGAPHHACLRARVRQDAVARSQPASRQSPVYLWGQLHIRFAGYECVRGSRMIGSCGRLCAGRRQALGSSFADSAAVAVQYSISSSILLRCVSPPWSVPVSRVRSVRAVPMEQRRPRR